MNKKFSLLIKNNGIGYNFKHSFMELIDSSYCFMVPHSIQPKQSASQAARQQACWLEYPGTQTGFPSRGILVWVPGGGHIQKVNPSGLVDNKL